MISGNNVACQKFEIKKKKNKHSSTDDLYVIVWCMNSQIPSGCSFFQVVSDKRYEYCSVFYGGENKKTKQNKTFAEWYVDTAA